MKHEKCLDSWATIICSMEINYSLGNCDAKLEGRNFVLIFFTTIILAFGDWFRKTESDHVAGERLPYPSAIAQIIPVTSIKLCTSKARAFSFVLYEMRRPCNNLPYHILPKSFYIVLKINIFEVIFYYWNFIRSWKQLRVLYWKWVPIFVMIWSVPFYYKHLEPAAVAGVLQRKL